jgi:archaellum component FlaC
MAHTCNQAFENTINALQTDIDQNKIDIQHINSNISTLNSNVGVLYVEMKDVKQSLHTIYEEMKNFMSQLWGPASSEQPSY